MEYRDKYNLKLHWLKAIFLFGYIHTLRDFELELYLSFVLPRCEVEWLIESVTYHNFHYKQSHCTNKLICL